MEKEEDGEALRRGAARVATLDRNGLKKPSDLRPRDGHVLPEHGLAVALGHDQAIADHGRNPAGVRIAVRGRGIDDGGNDLKNGRSTVMPRRARL